MKHLTNMWFYPINKQVNTFGYEKLKIIKFGYDWSDYHFSYDYCMYLS
jgi:hypothetical protein